MSPARLEPRPLPPADAGAALAPEGALRFPVPAATATPTPTPTATQPLRIDYTTTRVRADALAHLQRLQGVVQRDRAELSETFRMLRNQVLHRLRGEGHNLLAITSPRPTQGKSLTALNLALTLAADRDSTVLLVDAQLGGGGLQSLFGLPDLPGLGEHLAQGSPLPGLLVNPGVERLVLLPAGQGSGLNSAELLASRAAHLLVQELQLRYPDRFIIFDLPPLLDTADAVAFLPHVQATLVVVEEHTSALADLQRCRELLAPFHVIGTVLSPPPPSQGSPGDLAEHGPTPDVDPTAHWGRPPSPIELLSRAWRRFWQLLGMKG